jgi:hypothetical protein
MYSSYVTAGTYTSLEEKILLERSARRMMGAYVLRVSLSHHNSHRAQSHQTPKYQAHSFETFWNHHHPNRSSVVCMLSSRFDPLLVRSRSVVC